MITSNSMITPAVKRKQPTPSKPSSTKIFDNVLSKDEQRKLKRIRNADADMVRIVAANKARLTLDPDNNPAIAQRAKISPPDAKGPQSFSTLLEVSNSVIHNGDYVFVERDKSPNMNREEGYGFVVAVHSPDNTEDPTTVNVRYDMDNTIHMHVPLRDVTIADLGEVFSKVSRGGGSKRIVAAVKSKISKKESDLDMDRKGLNNIDMLRIELTQGAKRNKSKGWHRKELQLNEYYSSENNKKGGKVKGFCPNYNVSEMNQLIYEFDMLSAFLQGSKDNLYCEKKKGDGQFKKRKRKHNPASLTYLMFAWGASFTTVLRFRKKAHAAAILRGVDADGYAAMISILSMPAHDDNDENSNCVIDSLDTAKKLFTGEYLFVRNKLREKAESAEGVYKSTTYRDTVNKSKLEYASLAEGRKDQWEAISRAHIARQPRIKDISQRQWG
eukprot:scaffold1700_cov286-Chaetoceros_neogracile.AAC.2